MEQQTNSYSSALPQPDVIIKLIEGGALIENEGRLEAEHLSLENLYSIINKLENVQVKQSFPLTSKRFEESKQLSVNQKDKNVPSLDLFIRFKFKNTIEGIESLLELLNEDPEIEYASLAGIPGPPPVTPDFSSNQEIHLPAPDGINADYAWQFPGGDGSSVQICDCEIGFNPSHEDLPTVNEIYSGDGNGNNIADAADHGTKVLGVLAGQNNSFGVKGISHAATILFSSGSGNNRETCIDEAIVALGAGDILLLEMQSYLPAPDNTTLVPVEHDSDIFTALVDAITLGGICVVASAGNGTAGQGVDLSPIGNSVGDQIWGDPSLYSGAIIVGAGNSISASNSHGKTASSNFGPRVDSQGYGNNVVTTGGGDLQSIPNREYTETFNATSSAAAIIAGAAACIQGAVKQANGGTPLTPAKIRSLLSNPDLGTPQVDTGLFNPAADFHIGPLPDLKSILQDVYMRDNLGDSGVIPSSGMISASPDIFVLNNDPGGDPDAMFGASSSNANNDGLSELVELDGSNSDKFVFVRALNRGILADENVNVDVYWSNPGTLLANPGDWTNNLIGTATFPLIPGENELKVEKIEWQGSNVPGAGHYCFIGVINGTNDMLAIPASFADVDDYKDFVRSNNNIVWKNFNVVELSSSSMTAQMGGDANAHEGFKEPDGNEIALHFLVMGAGFEDAEMRLEIGGDLPEGAELIFEASQSLLENMLGENISQEDSDYQIKRTLLGHPEQANKLIKPFLFPKDFQEPASLIVDLPEELRTKPYEIFIRQLHEEDEVGRITWQLVPHKDE